MPRAREKRLCPAHGCVPSRRLLTRFDLGGKSMPEKKEEKNSVSRRDFLVAGGAVIPAGALKAYTPKAAGTDPKTATTQTKTSQTAKVPGTPPEKIYSVVTPLAERAITMINQAPRLGTLDGKKIRIYISNSFKGQVTMPVIKDLLVKKYPGVIMDVVEPEAGEEERIGRGGDAITSEFIKSGVHAVISGNGG
jgi:hypothetical protein